MRVLQLNLYLERKVRRAMSNPVYILIPLAAAYFIGNISPAILIAKYFNVDIRAQGSGNAGSTNVLRVLGKKAAIATLAVDILKGVFAVLLGRYIGGQSLAVLCGVAVFIGHIWPLLFGFRGGKGIATGFGVIVTIEPILGLEIAAIALLGIVFSKRVAVGSVLAAAALPVLAYFIHPDYLIWSTVMAAIAIIKHRQNIKRLLHGEETKISFKK